MHKIVDAAHQRARTLLSENRSILDNMAHVLVERETIYTAEVDMLMNGASYTEVLAYMEQHDKGRPDNPFGTQSAKATKQAKESTAEVSTSAKESVTEAEAEKKDEASDKSDEE